MKIPFLKLSCGSLAHTLTRTTSWGNLLALAGAWCSAIYLLIGRKVRSSLSLISYTLAVYGIAAIFLWTGVILTQQSPLGYSMPTYLWMLLLAMVPQLIGHSSVNWALGYLPAAFVSVALLGEPIGSSLLAIIVLKEMPTILEIIGGVLILVGIYWVIRTDNKKTG